MIEFTYTIAPEIFTRFPGYTRGLVLASGLNNQGSCPELTALLREAEESVRQRLTLETIASHPRIISWREAYRSFGAKPSEFRSSIEAMARRALRGDPLPSINPLVDIGNIVSLRHLVPAGSHAVDRLQQGELSLRLASGAETFIPLGEEKEEHPLPGEIIFAEGDVVLTRRWTWRQGSHTLTLPESTAVEFNVDGLPPIPADEVQEICAELESLISQFCGGKTFSAPLTANNPARHFCLEGAIHS